MLDSLAIALRGVGYDSRVMALLGFYPVDVPADDAPPSHYGGGGLGKTRDDAQLYDLVRRHWELLDLRRDNTETAPPDDEAGPAQASQTAYDDVDLRITARTKYTQVSGATINRLVNMRPVTKIAGKGASVTAEINYQLLMLLAVSADEDE